MSRGKFFVFEGLDGSGKSTQAKLLARKLEEGGYKIEKIDFPQYGKKSAGLVEEYLNGGYGSSEKVGPYRASIFYACDRYDASFQIKKWLEEGKIIISDRYLVSNIGHQGGKIQDKNEWEEYVNWIYNLEYNIFEIPKPEFTIILKTSPEFTLKLAHDITDEEKKAKRKAYLGDKKRDIHEEDINHQTAALGSYLNLARKFPEEFRVIECIKNGNLRTREEIHQEIWQIVKEKLE